MHDEQDEEEEEQ